MNERERVLSPEHRMHMPRHLTSTHTMTQALSSSHFLRYRLRSKIHSCKAAGPWHRWGHEGVNGWVPEHCSVLPPVSQVHSFHFVDLLAPEFLPFSPPGHRLPLCLEKPSLDSFLTQGFQARAVSPSSSIEKELV